MYQITKRMEISAAHKLNLPYDSPCKKPHGHNWRITVEIESKILDSSGMVWDFSEIKKVVNQLDHRDLNDVFEGIGNSTAENIAKWIYSNIQHEVDKTWKSISIDPPIVTKITVQESEGNIVCYTP